MYNVMYKDEFRQVLLLRICTNVEVFIEMFLDGASIMRKTLSKVLSKCDLDPYELVIC